MITASSVPGQEAVDAVAELVERVEAVALVLSNQRMPTTASTRSASRHDTRPVPSALLTAYADTDAAIEALSVRVVDRYLFKHWDPPEEKLYPVLADWRGGWQPGSGWSATDGTPMGTGYATSYPATRSRTRYLDVERDDGARQPAGDDALPVVLTTDGQRLAGPSNAYLAGAVGSQRTAAREFYDLAVISGGPAGLARAETAARRRIRSMEVRAFEFDYRECGIRRGSPAG